MKKLMVMVALLLLKQTLTAQEGGIQFNRESKWLDLLAQARSQDKLIMLDAYTTWCGPCKWMDQNVFADKAVGEFYNANFINAKFDMEKGEGLELAKTYAVRAYPTILFIDGGGAVMHRIVGGRSAENFMEVGRTALDPEKRLSGLERRFDAGERGTAFLEEVVINFNEAMHQRAGEVLETYLASDPSEVNTELLGQILRSTIRTDSKAFRLLLEQRPRLESEFGTEHVLISLISIVLNESFSEATPENLPSMEAIKGALVAKLPSDIYERAYLMFQMGFYRNQQDTERWAAATVEYYTKYPGNNPDELNELAWSFYQSVENEQQLRAALQWALQSVKLNDQYANNDTVAALYFKLGEKKNAMKYAEKAIALAKQTGEDPSETEQLLARIKKMK